VNLVKNSKEPKKNSTPQSQKPRKIKKTNMANFGLTELLIIVALIVLFFGGKKIPQFVKGLGEAVKEFRKGLKEDK